MATRSNRATGLLLGALVANGLLVGASLDQSIKQLPARHRIGVEAFSAYSQAADLRNGVPFYATLGLGAPALTLAAAALGRRRRPPTQQRVLLLAAGLSVGHLLVTAAAAPLNFSQRTHAGDPAALAQVFDIFQRLTAVRAGLQAAALATVAWALAAAITSSSRPAGTPSSAPGPAAPDRGGDRAPSR